MAELLGTALEVLSAIKACYDTMKDNKEAVTVIVSRVGALTQPLKEIQENTRPYPADTNQALGFLVGVLTEIHEFLLRFNERTYWRGAMRFVKSGEYAEQFQSFNKKIGLCLDSVSFNVTVRNEERRQEDMIELRAFIKASCDKVFHGIKKNIREEGSVVKFLDEVKEVALDNRSMVEHFLEKLGHDSKLLEAEAMSINHACEKLIQDSSLCHNEVMDGLKMMDIKLDRLIGSNYRAAKLEELKDKIDPDTVEMSEEVLGGGAFGTVYRGKWQYAPMAIKVYKAARHESYIPEEKRNDIEFEALVTYDASSPYIIRCYGIVPMKREYWTILELAPYGSMWSICEKFKDLSEIPFYLILSWIQDVARGLDYLYFRGVTHKDIKAENILIAGSPYSLCAKISDFGVSKQGNIAGVATQTKTGAGSTPFQAPEVKFGGQGLFAMVDSGCHSNHASDIFSLGIMMLQVLDREIPLLNMNQYQMRIHSSLKKYTNFASKDSLGLSARLLYSMLSVEPLPVGVAIDISDSSVVDRRHVKIDYDTYDPRNRPLAKEVTFHLGEIIQNHLGGDPRQSSGHSGRNKDSFDSFCARLSGLPPPPSTPGKEQREKENDLELLSASEEGNMERARKALIAGADINARDERNADSEGKTPLMLALEEGFLLLASFLIDNGADINTTDNTGFSVLMWAASDDDNSKVIQRLLAEGHVDINAKDEDGCTALTVAAWNDSQKAASLLVEYGIQIDTTDNDGNTAFMEACKECSEEMIELFIENGAEVNKKNNNGWTPLMEASWMDNTEVLEILIDSGADIDAADNNGNTALMKACQEGHLQTAELLLECGADMDMRNESGDTARTLAERKGLEGMMSLLSLTKQKTKHRHSGLPPPPPPPDTGAPPPPPPDMGAPPPGPPPGPPAGLPPASAPPPIPPRPYPAPTRASNPSSNPPPIPPRPDLANLKASNPSSNPPREISQRDFMNNFAQNIKWS